MTIVKKIFAVLFILLAAMLSLSLLFQLGKLLCSFLNMFGPKADGFTIGTFFGTVIAYVIFISIIVLLIKYARKWLSNNPTKHQDDQPNT